MKKRILAISMAALLAGMLLPGTALAVEPQETTTGSIPAVTMQETDEAAATVQETDGVAETAQGTDDIVAVTSEAAAPVITLSKSKFTIYVKKTAQISASVKNPAGTTRYTSSDKSIASVNSSGKITAKKKGTATITVKNGTVSKTVKVTVKNPKLNKTKSTLHINQTTALKITGKVGTPKFSSSNTGVASVSSSGKITAKKKGTATISVKTNGVTLKCRVTVDNPAFNKSTVKLNNSKRAALKVLGGSGKVTYTSSNEKVATVSSKGIVKGIKAGTCTITAKRGKYTMKCTVTVPAVYKGYKRIPDFGALYGILPVESETDSDMTSNGYLAKKSLFTSYKKKIKSKGFHYQETSDGVEIWVNDYNDMIGVMYDDGIVVVTCTHLDV